MQPDREDGESVSVFMMTHVLRNLPTAQHKAWVCSAGPKGYCATKEMLQNGIPGHTILIKRDDLLGVDASSEECSLLSYCYPEKSEIFKYYYHIPSTVGHITGYGNISETPMSFLRGCTGLTALNLSPLPHPGGLPRRMHWSDYA